MPTWWIATCSCCRKYHWVVCCPDKFECDVLHRDRSIKSCQGCYRPGALTWLRGPTTVFERRPKFKDKLTGRLWRAMWYFTHPAKEALVSHRGPRAPLLASTFEQADVLGIRKRFGSPYPADSLLASGPASALSAPVFSPPSLFTALPQVVWVELVPGEDFYDPEGPEWYEPRRRGSM